MTRKDCPGSISPLCCWRGSLSESGEIICEVVKEIPIKWDSFVQTHYCVVSSQTSHSQTSALLQLSSAQVLGRTNDAITWSHATCWFNRSWGGAELNLCLVWGWHDTQCLPQWAVSVPNTGKTEVSREQTEGHYKNPTQCHSYLVWRKRHLSSTEKSTSKTSNFTSAATTTVQR